MSCTILIVEDMDLCREALEVALMRLADVSVQSVSTAEEALQRVKAGGVCALITDLDLPRMDGFALIETVRALPGGAPLPILVISGDTDPRTPARVARLGANAHFSKPYSPGEVRQKLEQLIHANSEDSARQSR
jgi:CheY-like chemotaxis protein